MIAVIDTGTSNIASVLNMFRHIGVPAQSAISPDDWDRTSPLVLPGVGAFDTGINGLRRTGWDPVLRSVPKEQHILGICLGMQLLAKQSEEGQLPGLGRIDAEFVRLDAANMPVPNMGWHEIRVDVNDPVFSGLDSGCRFYFTHSYRARCSNEKAVRATVTYGQTFPAAYSDGNTYGVQFHPEKSHHYGMQLLKSWVEYTR